MKVFSELTDPEVVRLLKMGAIGVIPTDTVYGIVASVQHEQAVERLYRVRQRDPAKACIVLIGKPSQVTDRGALQSRHIAAMKRFWPGPVSIVLPVTNKTPAYLHRNLQTLAYRMPDYPSLQVLLQQTGPLIAPSANLESMPPATTLAEAQDYFGDQVDFYVDGAKLQGKPSNLIVVQKDRIHTLR